MQVNFVPVVCYATNIALFHFHIVFARELFAVSVVGDHMSFEWYGRDRREGRWWWETLRRQRKMRGRWRIVEDDEAQWRARRDFGDEGIHWEDSKMASKTVRAVKDAGRLWKSQEDCGSLRKTVEVSRRLWKSQEDCGSLRETVEVSGTQRKPVNYRQTALWCQQEKFTDFDSRQRRISTRFRGNSLCLLQSTCKPRCNSTETAIKSARTCRWTPMNNRQASSIPKQFLIPDNRPNNVASIKQSQVKCVDHMLWLKDHRMNESAANPLAHTHTHTQAGRV
jgi:hypothetical protein